MIQPLRRAHQWIVIGWALALPAIFTAGLVVRQSSMPLNASLPGRRPPARNISEAIRSFQKILAPDLLVYWTRTAPSGAALPFEARLLGSLHGIQGLNSPEASGGYLLAYSLADWRVVAVWPLTQE